MLCPCEVDGGEEVVATSTSLSSFTSEKEV